jgi:hypothetical protein
LLLTGTSCHICNGTTLQSDWTLESKCFCALKYQDGSQYTLTEVESAFNAHGSWRPHFVNLTR